MRLLIFCVLAMPLALANLCGVPPPLCEVFPRLHAVFTGTVLAKQGPYFRVRVQEAFKGIRAQQEILIDPAGVFSGQYKEAKQYLFAISRAPYKDSIYPAEGCSITEEVSRRPDDLAWVRSREPRQTRIYGLVVQNYVSAWRPPQPDLDRPLVGARVTLMNQDGGQKFETVSGPDGSYAFEGIPPGNYRVRAEKPPWKALDHQYLQDDPDLSPGSCARRHLTLFSPGRTASTETSILPVPARQPLL